MKHTSGFFLADALLALFIFLLGVGAIHRLVQATTHARRDHQIRLMAASILEDAPAWRPRSQESNWQRHFNLKADPVQQDGFFKLTGTELFHDGKRTMLYGITYVNRLGQPCRFWRKFEFWEADHAGI